MGALKVLFIGGSGIISSACARLAVERGIDLYVLNRGSTGGRAAAGGGDRAARRHPRPGLGHARRSAAGSSTPSSTGSRSRPSTCRPTSTCSAAAPGSTSSSARPRPTRPRRRGCRSSSPRRCATRSGSTPATRSPARTCWSPPTATSGFPATIVRPSHTYDRTLVPFDGGWTVVARMRQGKEVVVHGDGTSLWTLTHHEDFATGFVPLLGHPRAVGDAFHITSDDVLTWNQIAEALAAAAGVAAADRARAVRRDRRRRPRVGRRPARRQGALDGLRQREAARRWCRTTSRRSRSSRARARSSPGTTRTRPGSVVDARLDAVMDRLVERYRVGHA